jgi:hypothetical protein
MLRIGSHLFGTVGSDPLGGARIRENQVLFISPPIDATARS